MCRGSFLILRGSFVALLRLLVGYVHCCNAKLRIPRGFEKISGYNKHWSQKNSYGGLSHDENNNTGRLKILQLPTLLV